MDALDLLLCGIVVGMLVVGIIFGKGDDKVSDIHLKQRKR
jgi:hypothetical protein